ncbi:MAG: penicillin-binding protein 2 [Nitrospirae bacterium]|nr:penicillin-binding protein 2 [Nitrospirota bacterium]
MPRPEEDEFRSRGRAVAVLAVLAALYAALGIRVVYLQVIRGPDFVHRAERQHEKAIAVEAERGTIYDRHGNILAADLTVPSLYAVPPLIDNPGSIARELAVVLGVDPLPLAKRLAEPREFIWLSRRVDPAVAKAVEDLGAEGVRLMPERRRIYPKKALLGQALGFAGTDHEGLEGIERAYDRTLRGEKGWLVYERDGMGQRLFPKDLRYVAPSRGGDLVLTIDEVVQYISERELDAVIAESGADGGTIVVMDPADGGVLAMAVRQAFNPNDVDARHPASWRNRAITDLFEPGSTFKVVTAAAALEAGVVRADDLIDCERGAWPIAGGVLHDHEPLGRISFSDVIAKSSNIGTAKVALRLGQERLARSIAAFGFGRKTGIDVGGEVSGRVRPTARWSGRSLATMAIGQEVGVTAIQLVTAYAAVANGGRLVKPHLVVEVRDERGRAQPIAQEEHDETHPRVMSEQTAEVLTTILERVVSPRGTGALAAVEGVSVAGKTGTAQQIDPATGRYTANRVVSSFVGFAPSRRPAVVVLVVIDNPEGHGWGGSVAAPVFRRVVEATLRHLETPSAPSDPVRPPATAVTLLVPR